MKDKRDTTTFLVASPGTSDKAVNSFHNHKSSESLLFTKRDAGLIHAGPSPALRLWPVGQSSPGAMAWRGSAAPSGPRTLRLLSKKLLEFDSLTFSLVLRKSRPCSGEKKNKEEEGGKKEKKAFNSKHIVVKKPCSEPGWRKAAQGIYSTLACT